MSVIAVSMDSIRTQHYVGVAVAVVVGLLSVLWATDGFLVSRLLSWLLSVLGTAIGVAWGLGLAMHVYQTLQDWQQSERRTHQEPMLRRSSVSSRKRRSSKSPATTTAPTTTTALMRSTSSRISSSTRNHSHSQSSVLEDGTSYTSMMAMAGYVLSDNPNNIADTDGESNSATAQAVWRGQVLKWDAPFWNRPNYYSFTQLAIPQQFGVRRLEQDWPGLPIPVRQPLGRLLEHLMRDFIAGWYCKIDAGCQYPQLDDDEEPQDEQREVKATSDSPHPPRRMVLSTRWQRQIPFLEQTYRVLSVAFGSLATRAEHINVWKLILIQYTSVLANTFQHYRHLRRLAQTKSQMGSGSAPSSSSTTPSELHMIREFLLAGKFHKAITFGLDVPSLLFADANGTECYMSTQQDKHTSPTPRDPLEVLKERLLESDVLQECEMDYNRVLASRLTKALLPRNESSSLVASTLVTEILASAVLQPIMNLWIPSFLNELIVKATATNSDKQNRYHNQNHNHHEHDADMDATGNTNDEGRGTTTAMTTNASSNGTSARATGAEVENSNTAPLLTEQPTNTTLMTEDLLEPSSEQLAPPIPGQTRYRERANTGSTTSTTMSIEELSEDPGENPNRENSLLGNMLLKLVAIAMKELHRFVNWKQERKQAVDFDAPDCQEAIIRLVLVVEAVMLQGRCPSRRRQRHQRLEHANDEQFASHGVPPVEEEEVSFHELSFSQLLMEMTSDMNLFEQRLEDFAKKDSPYELDESNDVDLFEPDANEISTVRTLISTWMHAGMLPKAIDLIIKGTKTVFRPFYSDDALLSVPRSAEAFQSQIKVLEGVDIMVETMIVLSSPRLDYEAESAFVMKQSSKEKADSSPTFRESISENTGSYSDAQHNLFASDLIAHNLGTAALPRYLAFHRNAAFAASLRSERERRMRSWQNIKGKEILQPIHRERATIEHIQVHRELHSLARFFNSGTATVSVRDAARRNEDADVASSSSATPTDSGRVSLITVETVSNRRRIEIPDDDSSFLLRAQPRALNPVSVHRDDRNHDLSYKCYLATYSDSGAGGGRYIKRVWIQYYPIDRTATVLLNNDTHNRKMDRRKGKTLDQNPPTLTSSSTSSYLTTNFLRERHLCQKAQRRTGAQSFLTSSVIEASDFNAIPRSGRALDFVYRMSLFECPTIDLAGKQFAIQDSTARGHHRADASSLEISDASLSFLLNTIGKEVSKNSDESANNNTKLRVEMGHDGYPVIFMKFTTTSGNDEPSIEIKPYRASFVRAALMVKSARQEAQLQCLMDCVKQGSAKSATKARTDTYLEPTMKILEFANDRSGDKVKEALLLRDLKLGMYHIDRDQLRRNGLLNPRFPTVIHNLKATVEGSTQAKDVPELFGAASTIPPTSILYKIRCVATVELLLEDDTANELESYICEDGTLAYLYQEEWTIYRSMKDFQAFHKHMKAEVATSESSTSTGSRLVGAAAAAFSSSYMGRRHKKALVPSLAQASTTGAIAVTQKAVARRGGLLGSYLEYLLAPGHAINQCTELLLFLGASFPFPPEITGVMATPLRLAGDPLGRTEFVRLLVSSSERRPGNTGLSASLRNSASHPGYPNTEAMDARDTSTAFEMEKSEEANLNQAILDKIDQVPLAEVRNRMVELIKYQFGFENASFFRSRLLSALETASFVAVTKGSEFRKLLYKTHVEKLSADAVGGMVEKLLDILWPGGSWMTPRAAPTPEEEEALREKSRACLHGVFPDQIRTILGKDLTHDGLDMFHEMLQNRLVVKSLFYMLFDLLWIEIFPELRDVLPCASALDIE